jgi:cysteine desulfurase family protein (TIGR01976 family)
VRVKPGRIDNARVRGLYPALASHQLFFDSPGGALPPELVLGAMTSTLRASPTSPGGVFARSRHTAVLADRARAAIGDLANCVGADVLLSAELSTAFELLARGMAKSWRLGDEIVLSRLDQEANIRPWLTVAKAVGAQVRWAHVDVETCELPVWQYEELINARTRIVALPAASAAVGTRPDAAAIAEIAHRHGALVVLNAAALAPHAPIDLHALGADLLGLSLDALGGPRVAAVATAPGVLDGIESDWPGIGPARFERGGLAAEQLSGLIAAVDHLAALLEPQSGDRRARLVASMTAVASYEQELFATLIDDLRAIDGVTVVCADKDVDRVPILQLGLQGISARETAEALATAGISVWDGDAHSPWLMSDLGVEQAVGADTRRLARSRHPSGRRSAGQRSAAVAPAGLVTVGVMAYTSRSDVKRLVRSVATIAAASAQSLGIG